MGDGLTFPETQRAYIEFRDGERLVPHYLVAVMAGIETHRMTYEEALAIANQRMEADFINRAGENFIRAHFRENR